MVGGVWAPAGASVNSASGGRATIQARREAMSSLALLRVGVRLRVRVVQVHELAPQHF